MTILVTGARGFIGRHLAARLAGSGGEVIGIGHGQWVDAGQWGVADWLNASVAEANLSALVGVRRLSHIYHLAGGSAVGPSIANPHEDFERTVRSSAELFDWARRNQPQAIIVAVSSAAVYGDSSARHIREDAPVAPLSPYGHHKLMMETLLSSYCRTYSMRGAVARPFSVYGKGLTKQIIWDLGRRLAAGENPATLGGSGEEERDFIHVDDVTDALVRISSLAGPSMPAINIGSGTASTVRTLAEHVERAIGMGGVSFDGIERAGNPRRLVADCSLLRATGWAPCVPLDQGVAEAARHILQQFRSMNCASV